MAIQKLFTSRDNGIDSANYVGQAGRMFYDTDTGNLRLSDGTTPGGVPIQIDIAVAQIGNLKVVDTTIESVVTGANINIVTQGNGTVGIYGNGGFNVHTDGANSATAFEVKPSGLTAFNVPSVAYGQTGILINGSASSNTGGPIPQLPGTMLRVVGNDGTGNPLTVDAYGTGINSGVTTRGARGTAASPTATQTGDAFGRFAGVGYGTTNFVIDPSTTGGKASTDIRFIALENFTDSNSGSQIQFSTSPIGSVTRTLSATIDVTGIATTGNLTGNIVVANIANIGNLRITNQTIAGTTTDATIDISPDGDGAVRILNGIGVYQGSFSSLPLFSISPTGVVSTLVPNNVSNIGAFEIVGNPQGTTVAPQNFGVMLHTTGVPSTPSRIYNDGVAGYGAFIHRRYNGTSAAPTGVLADQIVGRYGATAYTLDDGWPGISTTRIDMVSTEDQTATSQGSEIQLWATENGTNSAVIVGQFTPGNLLFTGDIIPNSTTSLYSLGNATNKWGNLYLGPSSLFIEDTVTHLNAELTVVDGTLNIDNAARIQIGNMRMTTAGISHISAATGQDLEIGTLGATGNTWVRNYGIRFKDDTLQQTAGIPTSYLGNALGVATLDSGGKVPSSQLPAGAVVYKGAWNASTNTPTLADGTGSAGDEYSVSVAGTVNFGSGPITFAAGDFVIYSGTVWQKIPTAIGVSSFNTRTGAVTLSNADVITALNSSSIQNVKLANSNVTINTGFGLGGGGVVSLGGSLTLTPNVGNILPGTGVGITAASGNYTVSIGQPVGTANSVQFLAVTSNTTIQATGNVTGGNVNTTGIFSATGNVIGGNITTIGQLVSSIATGTAPLVVTSTTQVANLNVATAGTATTAGTVTTAAQPNITSVGTLTSLSVTGNITGANITGVHYGAGNNLSNIQAANVSGTVALATHSSVADTANAVTGGNVSGQVANALVAGTVYTNAQPNITSIGTLTSLSVSGNANIGNIGTGGLITATGNITGANLVTSGLITATGNANVGNLNVSSGGTITAPRIIINDGGLRTVTNGTAATIDFSADSIIYWNTPSGTATVTLTNYTAGARVKLIIRVGATSRDINYGIAAVDNSTTGATSFNGSGAGSTSIANQAFVLDYTCIDNTAANCYVQVSWQ